MTPMGSITELTTDSTKPAATKQLSRKARREQADKAARLLRQAARELADLHPQELAPYLSRLQLLATLTDNLARRAYWKLNGGRGHGNKRQSNG